jgi:hypothetical protein
MGVGHGPKIGACLSPCLSTSGLERRTRARPDSVTRVRLGRKDSWPGFQSLMFVIFATAFAMIPFGAWSFFTVVDVVHYFRRRQGQW